MDLPSKHVSHLSKRIGTRIPGSDGEAAAASYILNALGVGDVEVDMESFSTWKSDVPGLVTTILLSLVAYLMFMLSHTLSLVLSIIAFLVFQMETYTWAVMSRLMPRSSASNVVGRVRAHGEMFNRVALVANYDSTKSSPVGRPFIARSYRVLYIICFICVTVVVLVSMVGLGASYAKFGRNVLFLAWLISSPFAAYLLILAFLLLWGVVFGRPTPGANDNASGVGVMLSVMSGLAVDPLEHTEVWGVATARGFAGGRGMIAFLRGHKRQMRDAYIINIDHVGAGNLKVIGREGPMLGFKSSRRLKQVVTRAAKLSEELKVGRGNCRVKKSDAMVARVRGFRAVTIGCLTGGSYYGFRSVDDTFDIIERDRLDDAVELVNLALEEIDATL